LTLNEKEKSNEKQIKNKNKVIKGSELEREKKNIEKKINFSKDKDKDNLLNIKTNRKLEEKNKMNEIGNLIIDKTNEGTNKYINFIKNLNIIDADKKMDQKKSK
jgi:hypothetical protein